MSTPRRETFSERFAAKRARTEIRKIVQARVRGETIKAKRGHYVPKEKGTRVLPKRVAIRQELQNLRS